MKESEKGKAEEFVRNVVRLLRYSTKPSRDEVYQVTKIVVLSLIVIGFIGFILKLIAQAIVGV